MCGTMAYHRTTTGRRKALPLSGHDANQLRKPKREKETEPERKNTTAPNRAPTRSNLGQGAGRKERLGDRTGRRGRDPEPGIRANATGGETGGKKTKTGTRATQGSPGTVNQRTFLPETPPPEGHTNLCVSIWLRGSGPFHFYS